METEEGRTRRIAAVYVLAVLGPVGLTAVLTFFPAFWPRPYSWQFFGISIGMALAGGVGPALVSHTLGTAAVLWLSGQFGKFPSPLHPGVEMFAAAGLTLMVIIHRLRRTERELRARQEDLPARRAAEAALHESTALLQAISDQSSDVIFVKDVGVRIRFANPATLALIGKPLEEVIGRTDAQFLDDKDAAREVMENDRRIMSSGVAEEIEEIVPLPDGTVRVWLSRKSPYRNQDGRVVGLLGISRDITDRKRAEEALAGARRRLDSALIAGEVGTFEWDIVTDRLWGDENFARIFSIELDADGAAPLAVYIAAIHLDDRDKALERIARTVETGCDYEAEYRIVSTGEPRWVIARGKCETDASGRAVRFPGVVLDITARKRAEAEREAMLAENARLFREAQAANELKDQFLATLSHELRTPLNVVLGHSRMLRGYASTPERVLRGSTIIERNASAQLRMVEDLLDVQRILRGGLQMEHGTFELYPLGLSVVESLQHLAAAKNLHTTAHFERLAVEGDRVRIQQVIWNLLSNAIKFTPEGGCIAIAGVRDGDHVAIRVEDSGEGIPAHFLPHLFEPFRQLDMTTTRRHSGLGLGLAIVKHIVDGHEGVVEVQSREGIGSKFTVRLPLRASATAVA